MSLGAGFNHPLLVERPSGIPANSAFGKTKFNLDAIATPYHRYYVSASAKINIDASGNRAGLITDWTDASGNISIHTRFAVHTPTFTDGVSKINVECYDETLTKVEGGGLDIYDADCNLVQENATSIQVLADLYVDDLSCDGTGVRIGDEPPNVACSMTGVAT